MGEWKERKLGDLLRIKHGYAFAGEHIVTDDNGKVLVTPGNFAIGGGWKPSYKKFYSGEFPDDYILGEGDLVVTMTDLSKEVDTLGFSARVPKDNRRTFLHNQRIGLVTDIADEAEPDFLYWVMRTAEYRASIVGTASGSTVSHTSPSRIYEYAFDCPDLPEQRAIASVLSSLDAKIDLLHRQNKTLEAMAEALFRQWFVERCPEFAEGEAEEGWEETDIYSLVNVIYGFPFKSKYFNEDGRGLPLIRIRDLKDGASNVYTDEPCDDKFVLQCGDLVAGMDGEFRLYIWSGSKAVLNQRACKFTPAHEYVPYMYVLNLMRPHLHYYENTKVGTTVIHLGKSDIDEIRVALPPKDLLLKYGAATDPMHKKIINNHTQLRSLTALRDTLLPKLMSGEVRVEEPINV